MFVASPQKSDDIVIAGSTFVQLFIEKPTLEFMTKIKHIKINVQGGILITVIIIFDKAKKICTNPPDERTLNYISGRFI